MPSFNQLIGKIFQQVLLTLYQGIFSLIALIIVVAISAGFYPAFVLASFNPVEVLKGTSESGLNIQETDGHCWLYSSLPFQS